jgi:hypothetical protein
MARALAHRKSRTEYRTDAPPKDGSEVVMRLSVALTVYWDDELKTWVLVRPLHLETLSSLPDIVRWKRKRGPAP